MDGAIRGLRIDAGDRASEADARAAATAVSRLRSQSLDNVLRTGARPASEKGRLRAHHVSLPRHHRRGDSCHSLRGDGADPAQPRSDRPVEPGLRRTCRRWIRSPLHPGAGGNHQGSAAGRRADNLSRHPHTCALGRGARPARSGLSSALQHERPVFRVLHAEH